MHLQILPLPGRMSGSSVFLGLQYFWSFSSPYSFFEIITDTGWWWFRMISLPPNDQFNCKIYLQQQQEWEASPGSVSSSMGWETGRSVLSTTLFRNQEVASVPRCPQRTENGRMTSSLHNWTGERAVKGGWVWGRAMGDSPLSRISAHKRGRRGKFFNTH